MKKLIFYSIHHQRFWVGQVQFIKTLGLDNSIHDLQ